MDKISKFKAPMVDNKVAPAAVARRKRPNFSEYPQKILIVEDDHAQHLQLSDTLKETFPYLSCKFVETGEEAWEKATKTDYDFIILDWKLPERLSGLSLLNRFREDIYYRHIPILVLSGYLTNEDFSLMDEYSYTGMVLKPYRSILLVRKIKDLFEEAKWHFSQRDRLSAVIEKGLKCPQIMKEAISSIIEDCPRKLPLLLLTSRVLRQNGLYSEAESIAKEAKELAPNSLIADAELGKIYLLQHRLNEACQILTKAHDRSPRNLDRLCDLGAIHLQRLETEEAMNFFQQAIEIDHEDQLALQGNQLANNIDTYFKNASPTSIPDSFAGLLNAIGISYVRSGDIDRGIEHYISAFDYLFDKNDKAKVAFNLALGCLRGVRMKDALQWFRQSLELSPDYEKAQNYLMRLEKKLNKEDEGKLDIDFSSTSYIDDIDESNPREEDEIYAMDEGLVQPGSGGER